jgi:hypothetical protein
VRETWAERDERERADAVRSKVNETATADDGIEANVDAAAGKNKRAERARLWREAQARKNAAIDSGGAAASPGYFLSPIISRVRELQWAFAASIEPVYHGVASIRVRGTTDRLLVCVAKAAGKRCSSGTGSSKGRVVRVSSLV